MENVAGDEGVRAYADDIAVVRALAEEGRFAPLLGGRFFVLWGAVTAVGYLINWAVVVRALALPATAIPAAWFVLIGAGVVSSRLLQRGLPDKPGASALGNQVERAVWSAAGSVLIVIAVSFFVFAQFIADGEGRDAGWTIYAAFPPIIFGVYAIALQATAAAARASLLNPIVRLSIAIGAATTLLAASPAQHLLAALGIAVVSVAPGILMMRKEPAALA